MTPEELAAIEAMAKAVVFWTGYTQEKRKLITTDIPALCAEIKQLQIDNERLRNALKELVLTADPKTNLSDIPLLDALSLAHATLYR